MQSADQVQDKVMQRLAEVPLEQQTPRAVIAATLAVLGESALAKPNRLGHIERTAIEVLSGWSVLSPAHKQRAVVDEVISRLPKPLGGMRDTRKQKVVRALQFLRTKKLISFETSGQVVRIEDSLLQL